MTEDELRALVEQHHQLDELAKHPGWAVLEDYALHASGGSLGRQQRLVNGGARDFNEYLSETGWLAGAHHVLNARVTVGKLVENARAKLRDEQAAESEQEVPFSEETPLPDGDA